MKKTVSLLAFTTMVVLFAGCKKDNDNTATPVTSVPTRSISCKIDGQNYAVTDGKNGYKNTQSAYLSIGSNVSFISTISTNSSAPVNAFVFNRITNVTYPASVSQFKSQFTAGSYDYWTSINDYGFDVTYFDAAGDPWDTFDSDVSNANFVITSASYRKSGSKSYIDVKGTFNCQLKYSGNTKDVTDGKFCYTFANQ